MITCIFFFIFQTTKTYFIVSTENVLKSKVALHNVTRGCDVSVCYFRFPWRPWSYKCNSWHNIKYKSGSLASTQRLTYLERQFCTFSIFEYLEMQTYLYVISNHFSEM